VITVRPGALMQVVVQPADGSGAPETYAAIDRAVLEISLPRSTHGFLAARIGGGGQRDIWIAPVDSPSALRPFVASEADEFSPTVSPDGHWLAYVSNESGRYEVYVRSMYGEGGRVQVSTTGAVEPLWSPTGRELFYRADRKLIAAKITWPGGVVRVQREALFDDVYTSSASAHVTYSVMPDGDHFVFLQSAGGEPKTIITLNWFEDVRRRMAAARQR
jgi:Tol biopolymer transport system component